MKPKKKPEMKNPEPDDLSHRPPVTPRSQDKGKVPKTESTVDKKDTNEAKSGEPPKEKAKEPANPTPKKKKKKIRTSTVIGTMILNVLKAVFVMFCIGLMVVSIAVVGVVQYVVAETQHDDTILDIENIKLNQTSYILALNPDNPNAKKENDWIEYQELVGPEHRIWVSLDGIPDNLVNAVVATEDRQFYEHHGVSFERTAYALANEVFGMKDSSFGASTIDQQLIKNLTGDDDVADEDGDRSAGYKRKMREIFRAWGLNNRYSKDMIMEAYLNTMSLSETIAGVQAGAMEYFSKDVSDLTLAESATIAGITRAPTYYSPYQNPKNCLKRRNDVLYFMFQTGKITKEEFDAAAAEDLNVTKRDKAAAGNTTGAVFNYFSDTVFEEVVGDFMEQKGWDRATAINYIYTGGLRIHATVDQKVQLALEDIYLDGYDEGGYFLDPKRFPGYARSLTVKEEVKNEQDQVVEVKETLPQSAAVVLNYDGELAGVIGGIGPKTESLSLNRAVGTVDENGVVVGTVRQVGSVMKPIAAYALGIDFDIITYSSMVMDDGVQSRDPIGKPKARDWPKNFSDRYRKKNIPIVSAIAESTNTVAAQVGIWVGRETMFEFLQDTLNVTSLVEPDDIDLGPLVMGSMTHGMSAYELAGAYQMFGGTNSYGVFTSIHCYSKITDSKGNIVMEPEITTVQAVSPDTGYVMNRLLSNVLRGSNLPGGVSPTARGMGPEGDMDSVAKTGTTSDDTDRWLVGLTPYYVTAVWWGYDQDHDLYGRWSPNARTNIPPNVWKTLMETVQEDMPVIDFPEMPEGVTEQAYCTISGDLAKGGCPRAIGYYTESGLPDYCNSSHTPPPEEAPPA